MSDINIGNMSSFEPPIIWKTKSKKKKRPALCRGRRRCNRVICEKRSPLHHGDGTHRQTRDLDSVRRERDNGSSAMAATKSETPIGSSGNVGQWMGLSFKVSMKT